MRKRRSLTPKRVGFNSSQNRLINLEQNQINQNSHRRRTALRYLNHKNSDFKTTSVNDSFKAGKAFYEAREYNNIINETDT